MQKARRHSCELRPLVDTRFQVLFHSSVRSAFHLSLTVLVRYRVTETTHNLTQEPVAAVVEVAVAVVTDLFLILLQVPEDVWDMKAVVVAVPVDSAVLVSQL